MHYPVLTYWLVFEHTTCNISSLDIKYKYLPCEFFTSPSHHFHMACKLAYITFEMFYMTPVVSTRHDI